MGFVKNFIKPTQKLITNYSNKSILTHLRNYEIAYKIVSKMRYPIMPFYFNFLNKYLKIEWNRSSRNRKNNMFKLLRRVKYRRYTEKKNEATINKLLFIKSLS